MAFAGRNVQIDSMPVGSVIQSAINLEKIAGGRWMPCSGRDIFRTAVSPDFSDQYPAGVFTSTARTLAAAPASYYSTAATPTYFVIPAATGTAAMQYSSDGATWSQASLVTPASTTVNSIIWTGVRLIAAVSGSAQPIVTTGDNPGSTWTVTTGGTTSTLKWALAYSSSLAMTVMATDAASTSIYTLADGATAWSARTKTSSTPLGVTWTGSRFICVTATASLPMQYSTDGINWTDSGLGSFTRSFESQSIKGIASDGNGTVVVGLDDYVLVSSDHGSAWERVYLPFDLHRVASELSAAVTVSITNIQYVNGRFVVSMHAGTGAIKNAFSKDGKTWQVETVGNRCISPTFVAALAYKGGVYIGINPSTAALSATEDMGKLRLPAPAYNRFVSTNIMNPMDHMNYVKVLP